MAVHGCSYGLRSTDASEAPLYTMLRERLPDTAIISIAHHPNLAQVHERRLWLERDPARLGHLFLGMI